MVNLKITKANGKDYYFFCEAEVTKSGFIHRVTMFEDKVNLATEKVTYINRTWEKYAFQSAIKNTLRSAMLCGCFSTDVYDNLLEQVENGI
jgi:hypothetical protein